MGPVVVTANDPSVKNMDVLRRTGYIDVTIQSFLVTQCTYAKKSFEGFSFSYFGVFADLTDPAEFLSASRTHEWNKIIKSYRWAQLSKWTKCKK